VVIKDGTWNIADGLAGYSHLISPLTLTVKTLLFTVFQSIAEVFLLCVAGYVLAYAGVTDKATQRKLNIINVSLFTPALLFSKVSCGEMKGGRGGRLRRDTDARQQAHTTIAVCAPHHRPRRCLLSLPRARSRDSAPTSSGAPLL
jgi:hypothetical protein